MKDKPMIQNPYKREEGNLIRLFKEAFSLDWENNVGNDGAFLSVPPGKRIVVTQDLLLEKVHFFPHMPLEALAYKSLIVNLSDICADGGTPTSLLLGLQIPPHRLEDLEEFAQAFISYAKTYNLQIIGGDTVKSEQLGISVVCFGHVKDPWLRKGAKVGDRIYVSGTLGGSRRGLMRLMDNASFDFQNPWIRRHCYPPYRYPLVDYLVSHDFQVHAAIDVSDGFLEDLTQILMESEKSCSLNENLIPKEEGVTLAEALWGGEDYELILCSPKELPIEEILQKTGVPITYVGEVVEPQEKVGDIFSTLTGDKFFGPPKDFEKFFHF